MKNAYKFLGYLTGGHKLGKGESDYTTKEIIDNTKEHRYKLQNLVMEICVN